MPLVFACSTPSLGSLCGSLLCVLLLSSAKKPKSEFLCDLQFTNHLPDIPFEPKLLKIHLPPQRSAHTTTRARPASRRGDDQHSLICSFECTCCPVGSLIRYCASSLESCLKLPYLTDKFVGIPLDLLNPSQYERPAHVAFGAVEPADEAILPQIREALAAGARAQPTQLQLFQQGSSNWLRKQEFQSNNLYDVGIKSFGAAEAIEKEYLRIGELKKETSEKNSKEKQVELILSTFESGAQTDLRAAASSWSIAFSCVLRF